MYYYVGPLLLPSLYLAGCIFGGFHLTDEGKGVIEVIAESLKDKKVKKAGPSHCSGDDAKTIFENSEYKDFLNIEYIESRIQNDISVGIYENERLVAWGLIQDDGAMGFLHVLPEMRRKGYGLQVTLALIEKVKQAGKLPFACIVQDNIKSINLVKKLGFKEDRKKHWFGLK